MNLKTKGFVLGILIFAVITFVVSCSISSKNAEKIEKERKQNEVVIKPQKEESQEEKAKREEEKAAKQKEFDDRRETLRENAKKRSQEEKEREDAVEKARKEAEEKKKKDAEEKAKKEAAEKAKLEQEQKEEQEKIDSQLKENVQVKVMNIVDYNTNPKTIAVTYIKVNTIKDLQTKCNDIYEAVSRETEFVLPDEGKITKASLTNGNLILSFNKDFALNCRESEVYQTTLFDTLTESYLSLDGVKSVEFRFQKTDLYLNTVTETLCFTNSPESKYIVRALIE